MKTKNKTIKKIIAGGMAFVCACTAGIVGFATNWFGAGNVEGDEHNNQLSFGSFFGSGLSLAVASAETVDATSEGKTTLTVTVTPEELAPYIKVDWSVAWQNADSEWATGKTVTDYVTVTATADGALTAEVACKAAFGEKVVVSVSVRDDATLKAECVCDYTQRLQSMTVSYFNRQATLNCSTGADKNEGRIDLQNGDFELNGDVTLKPISGSGTGTIPLSVADYSFTYSNSLNPFFQDKLNEKGISLNNNTSTSVNCLWMPGFGRINSDTQKEIVKGMRFAHGMEMESDELTQECVDLYMAYREALEYMTKMTNGGYCEYITISAKHKSNSSFNRTYYVKVFVPSGYLPGLASTIDMSQTNVKF